MSKEREQLIALVSGVALVALVVLFFVLLGGDFKLGFIEFSVESPIARFMWVVPAVMLLLQQLYLLPRYIKKYWKVVSTDTPGFVDLWVPFVNEGRLMGNVTAIVYYVAWGLCVLLLLLAFTPVMQLMGAGLDQGTYVFITIAVVAMLIACIIRGINYLGVRRDIYEMHNKFLGRRKGGMTYVFSTVCYFVPLMRCISLSLDLQVLEKLTTFHDVANISVELEEE